MKSAPCDAPRHPNRPSARGYVPAAKGKGGRNARYVPGSDGMWRGHALSSNSSLMRTRFEFPHDFGALVFAHAC
eukprot:6203542-Pleurochrysis_carterae.AAC.1